MTVQPTRDQLRALADAATPHPPQESEGAWQTDGYAEYIVVDSEQDCDGEYGHVAEAANERLGTFIAAADPNTVRGILDQLDRAEHRIARLEAQTHIRRRAVAIYQARARDAEARVRDLTQEVRDERGAARDQMEQVRIRDARIKAVEDALDAYAYTGICTGQERVAVSDIRRALEG